MSSDTTDRSGLGPSASSAASQSAPMGAVYGLGFIGALVHYIQSADGLLDGAWGVVQACLWPAFLVHAVLRFVGA